MGSFIVKQPNGLYCEFSSIVDTITTYNMTEEEYINMCVERAKERAIRDAEDTLKYHVYPFKRIKDEFFPNNNSIEEFENILHEMGDDKGLGKTRIKKLEKELEELEKD